MGWLEPSEAIDLALVVLALPVMFKIVRIVRPRPQRLFTVAYISLLTGRVATIAEHVMFADPLNVFEHLMYAVSGILFAVAIAALPSPRKMKAG